MKKILLILVISVSLGNAAFAQKGMEVIINKEPDKIDILPGLYEFFGEVAPAGSKKYSYVLTTNEELVEELRSSARLGKTISFLGPKLEDLAKDRCLNDYADKRRGIEKQAQAEVDKDKVLLKKAEGDAKTEAVQELKNAQKLLKEEKKNTKRYMHELLKIVARKKGNCIYAYNSSAEGERKTNTGTNSNSNEFTIDPNATGQ